MVPEAPTPELPQSGSADDPEGDGTEGPRYLALERKDIRFEPRQVEGLFALVRRLQRVRRKKAGPRITDSTLVRAAVDLLLLYADAVEGMTEDELTLSLLTAIRRGTPRAPGGGTTGLR